MTTPHDPTPSRRRLRRLLVGGAVALTSLAGLVPSGAPAGAISPGSINILHSLGYDQAGPNGYHVVSWAAPNDDGGKPVLEYQIERWNADLSQKLSTYFQGAASGPSRTIPNMVDEVSSRYRVRARNADGWGAFGEFEGATVFPGLTHLRPFSSASEILDRQIADFGTPLSFGQKQTWNASLHDVGDVTELIDFLAARPERKNRDEVVRLYFAYFDRPAEPGGLDYWENRLDAGTASLSTVSEFFAKSQEFKTLYGGKTNAEFVTLVYQNVLFRDPEANGLAYWKGQLDQGKITRGKLMIGFSESAEGKALRAGDVVIADIWATMMRTAASNELVEIYDGLIEAGGTAGDFGIMLLPLNAYP